MINLCTRLWLMVRWQGDVSGISVISLLASHNPRVYVLVVSMQLTSTWWGMYYLQSNSVIWLIILSIDLEGELKILAFVLWLSYYSTNNRQGTCRGTGVCSQESPKWYCSVSVSLLSSNGTLLTDASYINHNIKKKKKTYNLCFQENLNHLDSISF